MRALFRMAAIAVAGATLYYAGLLNSIVIQRPERPGAIAVVVAVGAALVVLIAAVRGTGRDDAQTPPAHTRLHRALWVFACVLALVSLASWLALVPLFFAWRSLFSYFFVILLFAAVAIARMPLGDLTPQRAQAAGALTLFALPVRRLALVAQRGRAA